MMGVHYTYCDNHFMNVFMLNHYAVHLKLIQCCMSILGFPCW